MLEENYASEIEQHHRGVPPLLDRFSVNGIAPPETARRLEKQLHLQKSSINQRTLGNFFDDAG
jgi:hypothetical protein